MYVLHTYALSSKVFMTVFKMSHLYMCNCLQLLFPSKTNLQLKLFENCFKKTSRMYLFKQHNVTLYIIIYNSFQTRKIKINII